MEPLPYPPFPPIDANNLTDTLKKLPMPSQSSPNHKNDTDNKAIIGGESGLTKAAELLRNSLNESANPCEGNLPKMK